MAVQMTRAGVMLTIGIIILSLAALGGLYFVKQQGDAARREEAVKIANEKLAAESNQEVAITGDDTATEGDTSTESTTTAETDKATEGGAAAGGGATTGTSGNATGTDSLSQSGVTATELPQTGPAQNLATVLVLGALTFTGVTYLRSRKTA